MDRREWFYSSKCSIIEGVQPHKNGTAMRETSGALANTYSGGVDMSDHTTSAKICPKCGESKPPTKEYFSPDRRTTDGLYSLCRECHREFYRQWREANRERTREIGRQWRANNPAHVRNYTQRARRKYPKRYQAHNAVNNAVRDGKLSPASNHFCFCCGASSDQGAYMEWHHVDYSKPLDVFPLCKPCHKAWHRANDID